MGREDGIEVARAFCASVYFVLLLPGAQQRHELGSGARGVQAVCPPELGWRSGCSTPRKADCLSLSVSLSPYPCPSLVPRLRDWNAEGSFISCLQDLTAGSWQEGVTRRLLPTHTTASGAQGQEQEQVLVPATELMRISSAEDSDWQPQHPTGGWQEEADSRFFGQVRVGAGDSALQEVVTPWTAFSGACCEAGQADQVLAAQLLWHTSCPLGCLSARNSLLCLIPELLLSIYNPVTLTGLFLIEYLP